MFHLLALIGRIDRLFGCYRKYAVFSHISLACGSREQIISTVNWNPTLFSSARFASETQQRQPNEQARNHCDLDRPTLAISLSFSPPQWHAALPHRLNETTEQQYK